jgi:tRNA pseudouridine38-40 synthase
VRTIKLLLQYDGTAYAGWQVQTNAVTVQQLVEEALATVLREQVRIAGASRTDAGVHALGQVAAFKTTAEIAADRLHRSLNGLLPRDIRVTAVSEAADDFVPRFAKGKTYRYAIAVGASVSPFQRRYSWHVREALDFDSMQTAAKHFIGEHDFTSFTASGGGEKTSVRRIDAITFGAGGIIDTCGDDASNDQRVCHFDLTANGFLYKMVRNIIGTLVEVGRGAIEPDAIPGIMATKDRATAGPTAPAHGLCLVSVRY